jgi:probable HAF family extracellular repeat protein
MKRLLLVALFMILTVVQSVNAAILLEPYQLMPTGSSSQAVAIGDLNGDGRNDVVMTTGFTSDPSHDYKIFVFYQDSNGNLESPIRYSAGPGNSIALGDLNNDGKMDIVTNTSAGIGVLYQNADGTFGPMQIIPGPPSYMVKVADINGDGLLDVVSIGWGTNTFEVYFQQANGSLSAPISYPLNHNGLESLAIADVNNDGLLDVIVSSYQTVAISQQQQNSTFATPFYLDIGNATMLTGMTAGDINGDNLNEIIATDLGSGPTGYIHIVEQAALNTFNSSVSYPSATSPSAVAVADMNADGLKDVIVQHEVNAVGIYLQKSDGTLDTEQLYYYLYGSNSLNPNSLAVGDINGDSRPDLVMAAGNGLTVLRHYAPPRGDEWWLDLGNFGGQGSESFGASADGSVIVGTAGYPLAGITSGQEHAFSWTWAGGMVDLGDLVGSTFPYSCTPGSAAYSTSADGSVVVGWSYYNNAGYCGMPHAFLWTQSAGMSDLGDLGGGLSAAYSVSADGSVIVGIAINSYGYDRAFRWTQAEGMIDISTDFSAESTAVSVSANGNVIVGLFNHFFTDPVHAFSWTQTSGMVDLGTLGGPSSVAQGVSADGSIIVGESDTNAGETHAFLWTQAGGMVDIGTLPGGSYSTALGVSSDGSVVVGQANDSYGNTQAFRWTQTDGMQTINEWLLVNGEDVSAVAFSIANNLSADGTVIVGQDSNGEAFLARANTSTVNPSLPFIATSSVTSITTTTASGGGNIVASAGGSVTARGVCWSTSANPTTADNCTMDGANTGSFSSSITGLNANTPYHVRSYAINSVGTSYGSDVQFTTPPYMYSFTINSATGGSVSCSPIACTTIYDAGTAISITASPDGGYTFGGWSSGSGSVACNGIENCNFIINANSSVTATFIPIQYDVSVSIKGSGNGSITPDSGTLIWNGNEGDGLFSYSSLVQLSAVPDSSSYFVGWSGCAQTDGSTCMIYMYGNQYVTATFAHLPTLTTIKSGTGSGTVSVDSGSLIWTGNVGVANYPVNASVNVSAFADPNSTFIGWAGACSGTVIPCLLQMSANQSVTATFNANTDFSGSPTTGSVPLTVSFFDASINNPTIWSWDFGDGSTSTLQSPVHTYTAVGTGSYTVSLTATGSDGAVTTTKNSYILVTSCSALGTVKVGGTDYYYSSIQNAYNALATGESLQIQALDFSENLDLNQSISASLLGGYGCDYSCNLGFSTLHGVLKIIDGTITIENLIIQ